MLLSAAAAGFVSSAGLIIAIGAQNAFVLREGLNRVHVVPVVSICALSDITLILLGVAGIGALVQQWPDLLEVMRFGGAAFLGVYGFLAALRAWRGSDALAAAGVQHVSRGRVVLTCFAFTFLNPHVYLDTMVLLGSISTQYPGVLRWAFALGACLASIAWFSTLGFGARLLQGAFRKPQAWRMLDASIAVFMLVLCLLLLISPIE